MDAYEALVKAYSEEAGCSSLDGEMDDLLLDIADVVESDASRPNNTITEFQFLAAVLARAAGHLQRDRSLAHNREKRMRCNR